MLDKDAGILGDGIEETCGNPYSFRRRLPACSPMFFGREREIDFLLGMLSGGTPQSVSLVGERRIGKSSLAVRVFYALKKREDTVAVYLDCDSLPMECETANDFFALLATFSQVDLTQLLDKYFQYR